jgi:UDP-glucose 4-epimerase
MKYFVTGGAGFVGSHLVDRLVKENHEVTVYDNLSLGKKEFLQHHINNKNFKFIKGDILDFSFLMSCIKSSDIVCHLAANSDIIKSASQTRIDLEQGTIGTYNILESMKINNIDKIIYTSSSVIYGETDKLPINEDQGPLFPISMYGASKLACEALISAYCHNFKFKSWIYRFANVIGSRITHGAVLDFYNKLKLNSSLLEVLGDGNQSKPYIVVDDLIDGILFAFKKTQNKINYFNLGSEGSTNVKFIAETVLKILNLKKTKIIFKGGARGWPGDVSKVQLNINKLKELGWSPKYIKSDEACKKGIEIIIAYLLQDNKNIIPSLN